MGHAFNDNLTENNKIDATGHRQRYVDIHCHCLPAVDDGPPSMPDSLALCQALVNDGIGTVVATPHQLGRFSDFNSPANIREKVSSLNEELKNNGINLTVLPGADVRVDERICQLLESDKILTLADGDRYILLELPHEIFIDIEPLLVQLSSRSIRAVISHPERHPVLVKTPDILLRWLDHPVYLQVTAGSLVGDFGLEAQRAAWHFLTLGWISFVATDSHDLSIRRPCMKAAFKRISMKLGENVAQLVCIENSLRILKGQDVAAVHSTSTRKCSYESTRY